MYRFLKIGRLSQGLSYRKFVFLASDIVMIGSLLLLFWGCKADEIPVAAAAHCEIWFPLKLCTGFSDVKEAPSPWIWCYWRNRWPANHMVSQCIEPEDSPSLRSPPQGMVSGAMFPPSPLSYATECKRSKRHPAFAKSGRARSVCSVKKMFGGDFLAWD